MHGLKRMETTEDLSGAWCNANVVTSSVMEAISFVTPVLENFFICTVAEGLDKQRLSTLDQRCLDFIREESAHSSAHRRFNASLIKYLGGPPRGLALVESLLDGAMKHLSLSRRLLLAAALEHYAAVLSRVYMDHEQRMDIRSEFARELFGLHAREELDHCSVVFDLWVSKGIAGSVGRTLTILLILLAGSVYLSISTPWILHRKTGKQPGITLAALARFPVRNRADIHAYSPLPDLFSFVRRDYHPDRLFHGGLAGTHF